jgi:hypothetical protein
MMPARGDVSGQSLDRSSPQGYIRRVMTQIATISTRRRRLFQAAMAFDRI